MFVYISAAQGTRPQHRTPAGRAEVADVLRLRALFESFWSDELDRLVADATQPPS